MSTYSFVLFQLAPLFSLRGSLLPHSLWICQRALFSAYFSHSAFGMFSLIHNFCFHKANPKFSLFPHLPDSFSPSASLTKSIHRNHPRPTIWHCYPPHLPSNLDTYSALPLQKNQFLHFFLSHTAIVHILLPSRKSKSHYLPPWFINLPYTFLNPTLVSPDTFQTSYHFQGFPFSSKTCNTGKPHNCKGSIYSSCTLCLCEGWWFPLSTYLLLSQAP